MTTLQLEGMNSQLSVDVLNLGAVSGTGQTPEAIAQGWVAAAGLSWSSPSASLSGNGNFWRGLPLGAAFFPGGAQACTLLFGGALGLYATSTPPTSSNLSGSSYVITSGSYGLFGWGTFPKLLITFVPQSVYAGSLQKIISPSAYWEAADGVILFGQIKNNYDWASDQRRVQVAARIRPNSLELVVWTETGDLDLRAVECVESTTGSRVQSVVLAAIAAGNAAQITATLVDSTIKGFLSAPLLLGGSKVLVDVGRFGAAQVPGLLRHTLALKSNPAGVALLASPLSPAGLRARHEAGSLLASEPPRYALDLLIGETALRVPISSWQSTQQLERAGYLQCTIPACAPWVTAIEAATEFVVVQLRRTTAGEAVAIEMARAPIDNRSFDRGTRNFTATVSGYPAPWSAPEDAPGTPRVLTGVRSRDFGTGPARVRASITWDLRPGDWVDADGLVFRVDYLNAYVPTNGDAYMDIGEHG